MLTYAVVFFGVGALGGLVLAMHVLRGKFAPWPLSYLHAALGATGLVLLFLAVREGASSSATWALGALVVAALGGFYLASFHRRQALPPKGVVLLHAGLAVAGLVLLLTVLLG
jgi:hypothetical protein